MFGAKSMQMRDDYLQDCMLILDGLFTSTTDLGHGALDHSKEVPVLYVGLPGRLLNLDVTFGFSDMEVAYAYVDFEYLTDTWAASFSHHVIRRLCDEDIDFRHAVMRNMVQVESDICQLAALFRSNYTYYGIYHFMEHMTKYGLWVSQEQLGKIMNHDRTSISKAVSRIRKEHPGIWERYNENKGRVPTRPIPGES